MTKTPETLRLPITDVYHGVSIADPYRWLEDQGSPQTRAWLEEQKVYARSYLDRIEGRERIRARIREFLAVDTYDSVQSVGNRYFFRRRLSDQEQHCICMREGPEGEDQILVDPRQRRTGIHTAVKLLHVSPDSQLLLYEVKEGGERAGTFELLEIATRRRLPDVLSRGYLRGFSFGPSGKSFYYVHEPAATDRPFYRAAYEHIVGTPFSEDREIFFAGEDQSTRLVLLSEGSRLLFLVHRFSDKTVTDIYLQDIAGTEPPRLVLGNVDYYLGLRMLGERIFAITDRNSPNRKIVEIRLRVNREHEWIDVVGENDVVIRDWLAAGNRIAVSYSRNANQQICFFDLSGTKIGEMTIGCDETVRMVGASQDNDEILVQAETFTEPIGIFCYSIKSNKRRLWARRTRPFDPDDFSHRRVSYASKDGTNIPMFLVGRKDVINRGQSPVIVTSYGGYGVCMKPQFSVFVAFLMERGCLFALPNIRGGSEFGTQWHAAAKRCNRQTAYDDFLAAAEWLINSGRTTPEKLAIFGGSNSGLLVGAALTQRPDLFQAAVCIAPLLDMLRYHLFDNAHVWKEEFGTVEQLDDFQALFSYSPYHRVVDGTRYPAVMLVSGDSDQNCNPLHARKMTARLQAANSSLAPIFLDYNKFRGHSPVLPLSDRLEALTDRMAFLCDQLQLPV